MKYALILGTLVLAGCEACNSPAHVSGGVGVGSSGVATGVSVGQSCGPTHVRIGVGNGFGIGFGGYAY